MRRKSFPVVLFIISCSLSAFAQKASAPLEKTSFQISTPWNAAYDVRSDIVMVYGMNNSFEQRVKGWRERGYNVQFMTGIAWGEYQDYFTGRFDGKKHFEDGQVQRDGQVIWHGKDVPYVVPSESYLAYMKSLIRRAIDGGVSAIYLEEPEFWARGGYSEAFKKEWKKYYGFDWMPEDASPEATYLASKLKYHLYFNALKEVFSYAKSYSESKGQRVKCYVPTHSLINYSSWQIVSPEASLAALSGMDGYIAQVWTGTAREPNYFNGVEKERVFENAFLEYGCMLSMTAPTGRTMYFLSDPVEDRPRTWDDYKRNYEATFTAEIMYPAVDHFEVMPWPSRIYLGKFKLENNPEPQPISPAYATQIQVMVNALNDMPASDSKVSGSKGIGVLVSNSMMFQRFPTHKDYQDPQLSNFYGMVLPLLKRGVPVETVHMENLSYPATLKNMKVVVMSYANMKPMSPDVHKYLAKWVHDGGTLIYYGRDTDPFQQVREWWNTNGLQYKAPSAHLFELMHIHPLANQQAYSYGKGKVYIVREDPKELVLEAGGDMAFVTLVQQAYRHAAGKPLEQKNNFYVERGPYDIAAVMDENADTAALHIKGPVIDLFDPSLPVLAEKIVKPGEQAFLYDLKRLRQKNKPQVLCAASRVYEEQANGRQYSFVTKSPSGTRNVMRILLPSAPRSVDISGPDGQPLAHATHEWDAATHTCLLRFENNCDGVQVKISW